VITVSQWLALGLVAIVLAGFVYGFCRSRSIRAADPPPSDLGAPPQD
jgi:hypothetical protein